MTERTAGLIYVVLLAFVMTRVERVHYRLAGYVHTTTLRSHASAPMHWHEHADGRHTALYEVAR